MINDIINRRTFRPLLASRLRPSSGAKLWREQGNKLTKDDRAYSRLVRQQFDLHDADPTLLADRIDAHLDDRRHHSLPEVRAYELADHRRSERDISLVSAPLFRGKRQSMSWGIFCTGPDAEAFINSVNRT